MFKDYLMYKIAYYRNSRNTCSTYAKRKNILGQLKKELTPKQYRKVHMLLVDKYSGSRRGTGWIK